MTADLSKSLGPHISLERQRQSGDWSGVSPNPSYIMFQNSGNSASGASMEGGGGWGEVTVLYGQERIDNSAATTTFPLSSYPTYDLLDRYFKVTQSVMRMRRLRRELDWGGGGVRGKRRTRRGGGSRSMDLYVKLVHINKE